MKKLAINLFVVLFIFIGFERSFGQVEMTIPDTTVAKGEHFCHTFTVRNFEEVLSFQFALTWDASIISLDTILTTDGVSSKHVL